MSAFSFRPYTFADAPVCVTNAVLVLGASLEESISVPCRVVADPTDVSFEWTFTSSGERFEVQTGQQSTIQQQDASGRTTIIESNETHADGDGK